MAPPPEYDKEPKAPDKSATTVISEEIKNHSQVNDLPAFSEHKSTNSASNNETEFQNNKHVESLDDGQLRALLDEAIQYKCPKDREGKSSLFKELLEEVEHQDEVSEAASRGLLARGGGPHANSLQDLMAALKADVRPVRLHPAPLPSVSARAIHGGSLPSGVDTSFMVSEDVVGGGYLATVRCVNPPPLAERRVSDDELDLGNKRSKAMFPMYTARASLEIGSGAVGSPRAVTTTTPSNQVQITKRDRLLNALRPRADADTEVIREEDVKFSEYIEDRDTRSENSLREEDDVKVAKCIENRSTRNENREMRGRKDTDNVGVHPTLEESKKETVNENTRNEKLRDCKDTDTVDVQPKLRQKDDTKKETLNENTGNSKRRGHKDTVDIAPELCQSKEEKNAVKKEFANTVENWYKALDPKFSVCNNEDAGIRNINTINNKITTKSDTKVTGKKSHKSLIQPKSAVLRKVTKSDNIPTDNIVKNTQLLRSEENNRVVKNKVISNYDSKSSPKIIGLKCPKSAKADFVSSAPRVENVSADTIDHRQILQPECESYNDRRISDKNLGNLDTVMDATIVVPRFNIKKSENTDKDSEIFANTIDSWYKGLSNYTNVGIASLDSDSRFNQTATSSKTQEMLDRNKGNSDCCHNIEINDIAIDNNICKSTTTNLDLKLYRDIPQCDNSDKQQSINSHNRCKNISPFKSSTDVCDIRNYREKVGKIKLATLSSINPRNVKSMTIGKPEEITQTCSNMSETMKKSEYDSKYKSKSVLKTELTSSINNPHNVSMMNVIQIDHESKQDSKNDNNKKEKEVEEKTVSDTRDKKMSPEVQLDNQLESNTSPEIQQEISNTKTPNEINTNNILNKIESAGEQSKKDTENIFEMQDLSKRDNVEMKCFSKTSESGQDGELENQEKSKTSPEKQQKISNTKTPNEINTKNINNKIESAGEQSEKDFENIFEMQDLSKRVSIELTCYSKTPETEQDEELENQVDSKTAPEINLEVTNNKSSFEIQTNNVKHNTESPAEHSEKDIENIFEMQDLSQRVGIEMKCYSTTPETRQDVDTFSTFVANQHKLFLSLESVDSVPTNNVVPPVANTSDFLSATKSEQTMEDNFIADSITKHSEDEANILEPNITETDDIHKPDVPQTVEPNSDNILAVNQISDSENLKPQPQYVLAELSNNAYIFLTLPKHLSTPLGQTAIELKEIENPKVKAQVLDKGLVKKKHEESLVGGRKKNIDRNSLRNILLESLFKRDGGKRSVAGPSHEVDAAVPFSCISSPEVVAAVAAPAVDTKPRSVMSTALNGLPLPRAADDYKKSLDENGNAVQGIGSPVSGSNQHKKPRRKKSSKNETVIKSHQIDGYQGNKDLNEVLRFIESNADPARGSKLRGKQHDEDKKKRPRKQDKAQRAASLEELSRTTLEELTARAPPAPAKPERRSWGDERELADAAADDFQTVTKRRKPRRERPEPERPAPRAPARPRRESAPPSDRSQDSAEEEPPRARRAAPASYADMARARVPDLISSCAPARRPRKAPDVLARPPVLLPGPAPDAPGVTFGFAVNETLLRGEPVAACRPLRYLPPAPPPDPKPLLLIVDYVASAWEDVIRSTGKVRYFSE